MLLLVSIAGISWAQSPGKAASEIRFVVREKGTGVLIPRAELRVGDEVVFSDPEGNIRVKNNPDYREFEFYRSGYAPLTVERKDLKVGEANDIFLYPDIQLNQVVIRGRRRPAASKHL